MIVITYLINLLYNIKVHGVSVILSKEHLKLPLILIDATKLLILLPILVYDEREKCHIGPLY